MSSAKKIILFILSLTIFSNGIALAQDTHITLLTELSGIVWEHFGSPFWRKNNYTFLNSNVYGFGYKRNPFTGQFYFFNEGIIPCSSSNTIHSMTDGIVKEVGFIDSMYLGIIIEYNDIEIHYLQVRDTALAEGDAVYKGQQLGRISSPFYSFGPALLLRLKYKAAYFDPSLLLDFIIQKGIMEYQ
jgi:hypothetical protein